MTDIEQPPQNGIDLSAAEDDDHNKSRPADIEQDMREMERRKRVEAIMSSKLFREELERIVDSARDGGASGILQQLSDIVGLPVSRVGSVFKSSNCMTPINDIRGVESMGYAKGEKILRCKLAATFRLLDLYGWTQGLGAQITARLKVDQEYFLVNPFGLLYHEITASSLNKIDMQGQIVEQGTTNFGVNKNHFVLHSIVHAARPDIRCAIYIGCSAVVAISSLKTGLLPITKDACVLGEISTHPYSGSLLDDDERNRLVRNLGPNSKVILLTNHGALCCGETIEEAFFAACSIVRACETQLKLLPIGLDNLQLIPEESRKVLYDQARRPPADLEKKFAAVTTEEGAQVEGGHNKEAATLRSTAPKWRVGGAEFEALMRMLDNAGYRTGYIYRHPLIKSDPPKPKNDVELPPAVSSLGYLLDEEELYRQGIWKKGDLRKGGDRSRWLNSPNVYQKVEVLETGTPDPKKITKWVAEGSPTHSTPIRIEDPLQFVPGGTTTKEFKRLQQQIKDNRRADKISAGPQSHILEGVTWDEANRIKDATVSSAGDHVVLMGAASKGIIQRGYQHNATVYKAPYAKNPFDNVTDDEINDYKRTVERKKKSIHGEYTDTDFSESEALSSLQTSGAQHTKQTTTTTAAVSQSEPEDISEHQVMRIETQQAPVPSQPEVVLSDVSFPSTVTTISTTVSTSYQSKNHQHLLAQKLQIEKPADNAKIKILAGLIQKYRFLFERPLSYAIPSSADNHTIELYTIHKIDIFPQHAYPLSQSSVNNATTTILSALDERAETREIIEPIQQCAAVTTIQQNDELIQILAEKKEKVQEAEKKNIPPIEFQHDAIAQVMLKVPTTPPYRTVSHYGFNYPLTYLPTISLHPANLLSAVELQRQKIIAFINSTAMSFAAQNRHAKKQTQVELNLGQGGTLKRDDEKSGSFISVKEIQLEPKRRRRRSAPKPKVVHISTSTDDHEQEQDALSEQFSSLLSVSGTYPANSQSHSGGELLHDHFDDSGDNCSSVGHHNNNLGADKLYRSYILRNFLPLHPCSSGAEDHIEHKPETEQVLIEEKALNSPTKNKLAKKTQNEETKTEAREEHPKQHITLSLNTLKRRPSGSQTDGSLHEVSASVADSGCCTASMPSNNNLRTIEIHINVSIKNSHNVDTYEQEFKTKLEKVIDDEINMISQLLEQNIRNLGVANEQSNQNEAEGSTTAATSTVIHAPPKLLHYSHTLALLEHELENLLNSIINANERHNRAIMCDCKTKILQITEDIRASLNVDNLGNC